MSRPILVFVAFAISIALASGSSLASAEAQSTIQIDHTPPTGATPGYQVFMEAVFTNATSGTITWRNSMMTADAVVPMTNLSLQRGTGWTFAAYLPAQDSSTQISYVINASNANGFHTESYILSVDVPTTAGLTPADQPAWVYTVVAALSMASSTIAVLYWYTGRRLRQEGT